MKAIGKFRDFFEPAAFERIITLDEIFGSLIRYSYSEPSDYAGSFRKESEIEEYGIWLAEEV